MGHDTKYLRDQYELVRQSRSVLLEYCSTITGDDLTKENSSFGRGSIRNLLVHIANTYQFWIGKSGLNKDLAFTKFEEAKTINDIIALFRSIDDLVMEFIDYIEKREVQEIHYEKNGMQQSTEPLVLFTHVITHEFHHKGQILSFSRHLGYTPIDTDIMR